MHNLVIDKKVYCVVSLLQCYLGTLKDNAYIFEYGGGRGISTLLAFNFYKLLKNLINYC